VSKKVQILQTYFVIPSKFQVNLLDSNYINSFQWVGQWLGVTVNGHEISYVGDKNILQVVLLSNCEFYTLKGVDFMICE
jgi:hypothetical protein